jgi:uncharacterized protein (TIGR00661 family)
MRVLYGVQGTGNGHLTRATSLVPAMRSCGIETDLLFSGRPKEDFAQVGIAENHCRYYSGLTFTSERGRIRPIKTLQDNHFRQFVTDIQQLDLSGYDLVITDFEPVSAWAARRQKIPSIGISHQAAFRLPVPRVNGHLVSKGIMALFAPANHYLGLHWHHFGLPILPPVIAEHKIKAPEKNKIVVYMGFEDVGEIIRWLEPLRRWNFVIYAKTRTPEQFGHITVKPLSNEFHSDLEVAEGVISNAGFELASECITLGKKMLVKPLAGQFEQLSNAHCLNVMKRATVIHRLDSAVLEKWLEEPGCTPMPYGDVAGKISRWLAKGDFGNILPLAEECWAETHTPFTPTGLADALQQTG